MTIRRAEGRGGAQGPGASERGGGQEGHTQGARVAAAGTTEGSRGEAPLRVPAFPKLLLCGLSPVCQPRSLRCRCGPKTAM